MISATDYWVIGFYLGFMVLLSLVFRRFSKNTSDYYRGGGTMVWWMSGASGMMSAMSVWSFTGAAGAIYETGTLVTVLFFSNAASLVLVYWFSCRRFRRMRVVTYAEAIHRRYGRPTEQFYVWLQMPLGLLYAGISLNAVGVFIAAIFQTEVLPTILVLGGVVIFVAMIGGAWAVVAGDFVQFLLMLLVMVLAVIFALRLPQIGGLAGLLAKVPEAHLHWSRLMRPEIVVLWSVGTFISSLFYFNNMAEGAARFLTVKNDDHARKAARSMAGCFVLIPVLLCIPPMASAIVYPDLHAQFPRLGSPSEAAFVAICLKAMPAGLIGLLIAGIFAVAMASMDTGLNRNSGLFVRNVYLPFLRPQASDRESMIAAKSCTMGFGLLIIALAAGVSHFRTMDLFNLTQAVGASLSFPLMVPMVFGIFIRRAPTWAGWSTAVVGFGTAWLVYAVKLEERVAVWAGWSPLSTQEGYHLRFGVSMLSILVVTSLWYWLSIRLAPAEAPEHIREFFADLDLPVLPDADPAHGNEGRQYLTVGNLCLTYGSGVGLFTLIPHQPLSSRASFLFCGVTIAAVGLALRFFGRQRSVVGRVG